MEPADAIAVDQARLAKEMGRVAERLPVWEIFAEGVRGIGAPMLGKIVAEAPGNDLNGFPDFWCPQALWKRFGLHVLESGEAPRPRKGETLGFSRYRRSVAWQLGDVVLRAQLRKDCPSDERPYGDLYVERKAFEVRRAEERGLIVKPAARIKRGEDAISEGVVHLRAKRYVEKRVLRDLWRAWVKAEIGEDAATD